MNQTSLLKMEHSSVTPYYEAIFGKVYDLDALELLRGLPDNSIDLFITSPPYDGQPKYNDQQTYDRTWYREVFLPITEQMLRVLAPTGNFVLNYRSRRYNKERGTIQYELVFWLREQGWLFVEDFIWGKLNPPPGKFTQCLKDGVEYCFQFAKERKFNFYPEQCLVKSKLTNEEREYRNRLNLQNRPSRESRPSGHGASEANARPDWVRPSTLIQENIANYSNCTWFKRAREMGLHPASFPEEIPDFFIQLMTKAGDIVCDPFAGSGTVGAVATKLGRRFILGEIQPLYCEITKLRLSELAQIPL
ncbi:MAG TPA: site-specific DNA-methyltransferase, partial [Pyrinomonadaceae bacterium]|nr:site-specific DNA-methyltransferase [Pyrinomonadaceae bacterium]